MKQSCKDKRKLLTSAMAMAALLAGTTASADNEPASSAGQDDAQTRKVCRTVQETGSRLKSKKICMTADEWAEKRRQDRMLIERSQVNACTPGANC